MEALKKNIDPQALAYHSLISENMSVVIVGHVDHGKSTIIGRLLADTQSLPDGKLEQVKQYCLKNSRPFEYAFLLDALKDERAQGITIDSARVFFESQKRRYIIIDAPGHIEFIKNMVSGASRAEAALVVIDADEGIQENSKRHGYLLSLLGIKNITVLVNKMDLVDFSSERYQQVVTEYQEFLHKINITHAAFIPVSGREGDNLVDSSLDMPWYQGKTVLESLDSLEKSKPLSEHPLRVPIQGVYKFTEHGDKRRLFVGKIESGELYPDSNITFYPSGKTTQIKSLEIFPSTLEVTKFSAGEDVAFTVKDELYIKRGEVACLASQKVPLTSTLFECRLFWLGKEELVKDKDYLLKIGTQSVTAQISSIKSVIETDSYQLKESNSVQSHQVAECVIKTESAICFDSKSDETHISKFVLVDGEVVSGGGLVLRALNDDHQEMRENVFQRNQKWQKSSVSFEERVTRESQSAVFLIVTGLKDSGRKQFARYMERKLFDEGRNVFFLSMGNLKYGIGGDLSLGTPQREEYIRRLAEVGHLFIEANFILVTSGLELTQKEFRQIKTIIGRDEVRTVWIGHQITTDLIPDIHIHKDCSQPIHADHETDNVVKYLKSHQFIYNPRQ